MTHYNGLTSTEKIQKCKKKLTKALINTKDLMLALYKYQGDLTAEEKRLCNNIANYLTKG